MFERLLSPAIYVIDQLNYAKKFILVSLFFYIPLLIMSYVLVDQAYKSIVSADHKVRAGNLISELLVMREAAEEYRNIKAAYVAMDAGKDKELAIKAKNDFLGSYKAVLESNADYFENEHPGNFEQDINDAAKAVEDFASSNGEVSVAMQIINKLIAKIDQHILLIQESSGLSSDNDADIKAALGLIRSAIFKVHLHTGGIASASYFGIEMKFLNTTAYDFLDKSYQDLIGALDVLKVAYAETLPAGIKTPDIQNQFDKLIKDTDDLLFEFDDKVINASALPERVDDLYRSANETVHVQYQLSALLLTQIGERLLVQKEAAEAYMLKIFSAVIFVFVITVYLYAAFFVSFRRAISKISMGAKKMAVGDMTFELHSSSKDEMGRLVESFNESSDRVRNLVRQVSESADNVYGLCNTSQNLALETNELIRDQMDSTAHVAVAINEMSQTAQGIAECSQSAEKSVHDAQEKAKAGEVVVTNSVEKIDSLCREIQLASDNINELSDDSKDIAQVVVEIRGIAEQTNLLALNAAIEAARAGEQGRGFAVVADEVRSLSQRTHNSTSNIETIIQQFLKKIENSVQTMGRSLTMASDTASESGKIIEALNEINETLQGVVEINEQVSRSMAQQADVTNEIDSNVAQIKNTGEMTSEKSSESTVASVSMAEETQRLRDALSQFKV